MIRRQGYAEGTPFRDVEQTTTLPIHTARSDLYLLIRFQCSPSQLSHRLVLQATHCQPTCTDYKSQGPAELIDPALDPTGGHIPERSSIVSIPLFTSSEADNMSAENKTTVIVGAGSIGLWTAYHLAHANRRTGLSSSSTIIVIEASASAFGETSGTCTGCIHHKFNDEIMDEFGKYSFAAWRDLAERNDLCDTAGLRFDSIFGLTKGDGDDQERLPDWLRTSDAWGVDTESLGTENAMV